MAKTKRGKALRNMPSRGRGECPVCGATRIKLLYSRATTDGRQLQTCKRCFKAAQPRIDAAAE